MTAEEKKARELVEKWGIDDALWRLRDDIAIAIVFGFKERALEIQSVREHILKLKNETNVHKK